MYYSICLTYTFVTLLRSNNLQNANRTTWERTFAGHDHTASDFTNSNRKARKKSQASGCWQIGCSKNAAGLWSRGKAAAEAAVIIANNKVKATTTAPAAAPATKDESPSRSSLSTTQCFHTQRRPPSGPSFSAVRQTPLRAQSCQIWVDRCRRRQPLQRGRTLDLEKFWWGRPGLSKDLQARASEMASNAASWPRARIHGCCYKRDGKSQNIYSVRAHWNSPRPGHCWTFQLHPCRALVRAPVHRGNATPWGPVVYCVGEKATRSCSALNNEVTSLTSKKPAVAIKEKAVSAKPSTKHLRPVGKKEKKLPSLINVRYLFQPGELEGGVKRATDPIWSLKVYSIEKSVTKPNSPVLYYLHDGPKRSFVSEELLVIPPNTELPPEQL